MSQWARLWCPAVELHSWTPVRRMLEAAVADAKKTRASLSELLQRSNQSLQPLGDPLCVNLGLHRWLKQEREESYSDWLALGFGAT